jgi:hydroxymethylglutaryl-CoA lyase
MTGDQVKIFEVGPRDGLQNEPALIPTTDKVHLINLISEAGFQAVEATSFVSPKWVPQMADAADVMASITRTTGISYSALTPNLTGYDRAMASRVDEIAVFAACSETFSQKNINCSIAESLTRFAPVLGAAERDNVPVRGYVSCVVGCPYEGEVEPNTVVLVVEKLLEMGCYEVSLGDTIGAGTPKSVGDLLSVVLNNLPAHSLAGHFHDTSGRALDNIRVSLEKGMRVFDSAVAGMGGCPYAPGAKGNVSTGAVVHMMDQLGMNSGIDLDKLAQAEAFATNLRSPYQNGDHT